MAKKQKQKTSVATFVKVMLGWVIFLVLPLEGVLLLHTLACFCSWQKNKRAVHKLPAFSKFVVAVVFFT